MNNDDIREVTNDYLLNDKISAAVNYTRDYVTMHPSEAAGWYWYGISLIFSRKYQEALSAFEDGEALNRTDSDIVFGLGVAHYALGNYQLGSQYMKSYLAGSPEGIRKDEILGRAAMLEEAKAYRPAILYLEFMSDNVPEHSSELEQYSLYFFKDYVDYALKERPELGEKWLMLRNVNPADKPAVKKLVKSLISELSWSDAIYLYQKYLGQSCAACQEKADGYGCICCISRRLFPLQPLFVTVSR